MQVNDREPTLADVLEEIGELRTELKEEVKRWDERFFQLTRDTLNFTRNIIIAAAVVVILAPLFREAIAMAFDAVQR